MAEEKPVVQETTPAPKKSFWQKWKNEIVILVLAAVVLTVMSTDTVQNLINPSQPEVITSPANVILYQFNALSNNHSQNVELWLMNNGGQTADNISVFVRARDQQGRILYEGNVSLTASTLRVNETCTADYTVYFYIISGIDYAKNTSVVKALKVTKVTHTIEITWDSGRHVYSKEIIV